MNGKDLVDWRESVSSDLSELKNDVQWIKKNLEKFDNRQHDVEKQISGLKGVFSVVSMLLTSGLIMVTRLISGE